MIHRFDHALLHAQSTSSCPINRFMSSQSLNTRFGVIGTGRITRRLVADLQSTDNVTVTAIASRTGDRASWYANQYGIATAVEGYEALLRREDVDAVYISLPPSMHAERTCTRC